jgi:uncharacterized repeat protein (TIGR01451 family)
MHSPSLALAQEMTSHFDFRIVELDEKGEEVLVERSQVKPGETIHYVISHENVAEEALDDVVVMAPVPAGVTLSIGSQSSSVAATFEVQAELEPETPGLEWSTLPAFRKVIAEDGTTRVEPLPPEAIAAVRWALDGSVPSGETAVNTYRVVVN